MDPIDPAVLARRREFLVRMFADAPIAKALGMTLSYDAEGRAVFDLPYTGRVDHALGDVHGGVIATMLDNAAWFILAPYYEHWIATVSLHVQILEPARCERLRAVGEILRRGKSVAAADAKVYGTEGRLVAAGSGTFATFPMGGTAVWATPGSS